MRSTLHLFSLAAILFTGCSSSTPATDAQGAAHPSSPHGFTTAYITDSSMNDMQAQTLTLPAGWKLQGIVVTSPCMSIPTPVYRAYAPDGLTELRLTPAAAWKWAPNPTVQARINKGCFPFSGPMSATDFLKRYVETIPGGVHVVGPMPISATYRSQAEDYAAQLNAGALQFAQRSGQAVTTPFTSDVAALRIETRNGSFIIEQRLRTTMHCENHPSGIMAGGTCSAQVEILRAPQGKLDSLVRLVDTNNLPNTQSTPQWRAAEMQLIYQRGQAGLAAIQHQFEVGTRAQKAMFDSFMAVTSQNHQAFMDQQESSFRSSMNNAQASQNARTTAASDIVDYALDQQTVTGQGGTQKVSSAYSQTWSSTVGNQTQWYQTNDPNANPNGVLSGNWTPDTKVHGNGQSY